MCDVRRWTSKVQWEGIRIESGSGGMGGMGPWRPHRRSPVSEVQNGLDGVATTCGDVTLKTRKQRQKHVDSEALTLSEKRVELRGVTSPQSSTSLV